MTVPLPPFPLCLAQGQGAGRQDGRQRGETIYSGDCAVPSSGRLFTRYFSFNIFIVPDCWAAFIMFIIQTKDFPGGSDSKASAYNAGDLGSIPGLGRFPGEGNDNPLQYSCLENPMDRGAW